MNRYGDVTTWVQSVVTGAVIELLKMIAQLIENYFGMRASSSSFTRHCGGE